MAVRSSTSKRLLLLYFLKHGITRSIPLLNQAGKNRTVQSRETLGFTAFRNGKPEPIARFVEDDTTYTIYLGDPDEYVHGTQVYTLEYDFTNVITEFDASGENVSGRDNIVKLFQELYWDTNGTGWGQEFRKVTANFHVEPELVPDLKPEAWCYVGRYREKGQERCRITSSEDGFTFSAENLLSGENLTFVTQFTPGTFYVPLEKTYILVWLFFAEIILCMVCILPRIKKWFKEVRPIYVLYRDTFVAPQYLPPQDSHIRVAEAEQLSLKQTKKSYVATLLELAVQKKIFISKVADKNNPRKEIWNVRLDISPNELSVSQRKMLEILNGGPGLAKGHDIPIIKHTPTKKLAECADLYTIGARKVLRQRQYITDDEKKSTANTGSLVMFMAMMIFAGSILFEMVDAQPVYVVGVPFLPIMMICIFVATVVFITSVGKLIRKYLPYTERGVEMARYLDGLRMYIEMAEKDRLRFLQSVEGVDTTNKGIVKIYEKLLPWASLFGAEKSWLKELDEYYRVGDETPDFNSDFMNGFASGAITRDVMESFRSSTYYSSPSGSSGGWSSSDSGGGGSSSSSGGGGGGSSGGGGGGGGGGGW